MMQIINNTGAIIGEQINLGNIDNLNIDDLFKDNTSKKMKNNNYPTWLVPLDIAKELKDIGFNKDCAFYYDELLLSISPYHDEEFSTTNWNDKLFRYCVSLPTLEQVFEWFREKGYHSTLHTYSVMLGNIEEFRFFYEINSCHDYISDPEEYYKIYEEAREYLVKALIRTYKKRKL